MMIKRLLSISFIALSGAVAWAQTYPSGLIDKTVAVVGDEMITIGQIESQIKYMQASRGYYGEPVSRCKMLEDMLDSKLFLMQARIDSLTVNNEMVENQLSRQVDGMKTELGGEKGIEDTFGKPLYKLRQEWRQQLEDQSLTQQMQQKIASGIPELTPADVKAYTDTLKSEDLPMVSTRYKMSQICIYPDKAAAEMEVRQRLLNLRERIMNGEKFSTLARIYSEDMGSARRGGELGMTAKSYFWPSFADAAMSLKPGTVSQIVQTPDGFHLIEVLEKNGDMFNARHILLKPRYTSDDHVKAFKTLDSLRTQIQAGAVSFALAAKFYSQDPATRTNGGQMVNPATGSATFDIDEIKPSDWKAVKDLSEGSISEPVESLDDEGRSGNLVYKIIKVDKIIPAHKASFENDYSSLVDKVHNQKALQAIDEFISEKIKTTYVVIDPIFRGCDFARKAWKEKAVSKD